MELKFILESILFSAQEPLSAKELKGLLATAAEQAEDHAPKAFKKVSADEITATLEADGQIGTRCATRAAWDGRNGCSLR